MQLTPSSIPATIQLAPQTTMANTNQYQTQLAQQQQQTSKPSPQKVNITSQQIIKGNLPTKTQETVVVENSRKSKRFAVQQEKQPVSTIPGLPATPAGLTVQRIPKQAAKAPYEQINPGPTKPKIPVLNVSNVTISRVPAQQQTNRSTMENKQNSRQTTETRRLSPVKKVLNKMLPTKATSIAAKVTNDKPAEIQQKKSTPEAGKTQSTNATLKLETRENTNRPTTPPKVAEIKCDQCGRIFKKKEHLTQHVKLHAGIRPFKCTQTGCDKMFSRKEHLLRHLISHTGKKMFSCDVCSKPFSRKDNLNKHRRIHTLVAPEGNYKCETCNKTFVVKSYYQQHMQTHQAKKEKSIKAKNEQNKVVEPVEAQQQQQIQIQTSMASNIQETAPRTQQKVMHLQMPTNVGSTQSGGTITISHSTNQNSNNNQNTSMKSMTNLGVNQNHHDATVLNLPVSLASFVQFTPTQYVNTSTGQIINKI